IVVLAPSNPVTSIGPILAVPGIREALRETRARIVAVSPIVGGVAVTGPAGALMAAQGFAVSIAGVADFCRDFLDLLVCRFAGPACVCIAPRPSCAKMKIESRWQRASWTRRCNLRPLRPRWSGHDSGSRKKPRRRQAAAVPYLESGRTLRAGAGDV